MSEQRSTRHGAGYWIKVLGHAEMTIREADELSQWMVEQFPDEPEVWLMRHSQLVYLRQNKKARSALEHALALAPDSPRVLSAMANDLFRRGQPAKAKQYEWKATAQRRNRKKFRGPQ